uniref:polynucleotide adenylyltransferase n=1 Tax=Meloidogyne javanica TaxID=6303 RepID=A0A915M958_MELJA
MVGDKIEDLEKIAKVLGLEFDPTDFEEKNNDSDYFDIESKVTNTLSQNSLESEIEEESQSSSKSERSFSVEGECSTKPSTSVVVENDLMIKDNLEKKIDNEIIILKNKKEESSSSSSAFDQKLEKNNWKTITKNNGEITEQKYFDNIDWMNSNTKILIGGSYLLNTRTKDSDIDIIIIIPNEDLINLEIINEKQFYSNLEDCNISERNCNDNSFYCLLCQDYRTNSLRKIPGRVSTINLEFLGQQFDLILVVLPPQIFFKLNENNLSVKIFDGIIANFIELVGGYSTFNEKSKHLGMLLALSGYRANLRILELINEKDKKNFQLIVLILKVWAKNNFIYGNTFGFLSGSSISILACRFIMSIPNTTIINLLGKIFEYFSNKQIVDVNGNINSVPMILEVNTDYPNIRQYLDWNIPNEHINRSKQIPSIFHQDLKENLYPIWPIITPGFPTQNLNFNMNISTAKIIQETMRDGWVFC